jgi:hypothetical protein
MKKRILAALLPLLCGLWACRKDENCPPDLPCATQSGENTFGCYINGVPWVAKRELGIFDPTAHPLEVSYDETGYGGSNNNRLKLKGRYYGDEFSYIVIFVEPVRGIGDIDRLNTYLSIVEYRGPHGSYELGQYAPFNIHVAKLDTVNNIIAGRFSFTLIGANDTLEITDGRFDVRYSPE